MRNRRIDGVAARAAVVAGRRAGQTLAAAAAGAGLHVATACRWQRADAAFAAALKSAEAAAAADRYAAKAAAEVEPARDPFGGVRRRPRVEVHRDCPACGRQSEVRKAWVGATFWRCTAWPRCKWASWRPRSPWACRRCGGPTLWSHRRISVLCIKCGDREVL